MKSSGIKFLLLAVIIMVPMMGMTQNRGNMGDMQKRIKAQRNALNKDLKLSKKQIANFDKAYKKYDAKREKLFAKARTAGNRDGIREKMTELREGLNNDLKKIMTDKQYKKFMAIEKKKNELRRAGMGRDGGGRRGGGRR